MDKAKPHFPPAKGRTPPAAKPVGWLVEKLTRPTFKRRGFRDIAILDHWPAIVGAQLAQWSVPLRLNQRDKVLSVRCDGAMALEIQHLSEAIIARINSYYGGAAVQRIAIQQGPVPRRAPATPTAPPSQAEIEACRAALSEVKDAQLQAALARLGAYVKRGGA